ncbi:MAG: hypothetical protein RL219_2400 [Actinomycetota bacterium]|jgi:hypothetical protein
MLAGESIPAPADRQLGGHSLYRIYPTLDSNDEIVWLVIDADRGVELPDKFPTHVAASEWCRANGFSFEVLVENGYDDDWDDEFNEDDGSENEELGEPRRDEPWSAADLLSVEERILLIESRWIPLWAGAHTQTAQRFAGLVAAAKAGRPWAETFVKFSSSDRHLVACGGGSVGLWALALGVSQREAGSLIDQLFRDAQRSGWDFNT